jgi:ferritin-like protein
MAAIKSVARELVEKSGVDVEKLIELLVRNASAELTTFYYYTILRVNLIGLEGKGLKQIAEDARIEDRNHFEALVPRIYELGGKLPADMVEFHNISACPPAKLPANPKDINAMLEVLVKAEQCAVRGYIRVCDMTFGIGPMTSRSPFSMRRSNTKHGFWSFRVTGRVGTIAVKGGQIRPMWADKRFTRPDFGIHPIGQA